jgi:hypothetical protein
MLIVLIGQLVQSGGFVVDMGTGQVISAPEDGAQLFPTAQELLQNNGFETGALPPWHQMSSTWIITTIFPHSGTYCAADVGNYWIRQNFAQPVLTDSITSITFWSRQPDNQIQAFDFMYADSTYYEWIVWPTVNWQYFDITSWLAGQMGKTMVGLRFWGYVGGGPAPDSTYTDDLSIIAGVPLYDEVEEASTLPTATLSAHPTAFTGSARIDFAMPGENSGRLTLYDSQGALVRDIWQGSGSGSLELDGQGLSGGIYFLRLDWGGGHLVKTLIKR